jgi:hypothetical protein
LAPLPKIVEEIVSGVLVVFELFHFMWALLMEVVSIVLKHLFTANNSKTVFFLLEICSALTCTMEVEYPCLYRTLLCKSQVKACTPFFIHSLFISPIEWTSEACVHLSVGGNTMVIFRRDATEQRSLNPLTRFIARPAAVSRH